MNLTDQEKVILNAMKQRAGDTITIDEIIPLVKISREHTIVVVSRLIRKMRKKEIIVERTSKLGRGHKAIYSIPLTISGL